MTSPSHDLVAQSDQAIRAHIDELLNNPDDYARAVIEAYPLEYGIVSKALKRAGVKKERFYLRLKQDRIFAALWEETQEHFKDTLRQEAIRRAIEPNIRPVYQGGIEVGTIAEWDNRHLEWVLERVLPEEFHLPTRVELTAGKDSDFVFRMGEAEPALELPPGDTQEQED